MAHQFRNLATFQRFVESTQNIEKLGEFSTAWADWADLGSQKVFYRLTTISPGRTYDKFQIKFQQLPKSEKNWAPSFPNQKKGCCF